MATPERPDHYFVVTAVWSDDTQGYEFVVDDETLMARFHDGQVWTGSEWDRPQGSLSDVDASLALQLTEILDRAGSVGATPPPSE